MKILRQVNFSNLDEKMIAHMAKDKKGLADMKKQYKNALKNKDLSDKDRKNLEGLLNTVETVEKDPDRFVKLNFGDRLGSAEDKLYKKGGRAEKAERERLNGGSSKNLLIAGGVGAAIGAAGAGAYAAHKVHSTPIARRTTTPAKAGLKTGLIAGGTGAAIAGLEIAAHKALAKNSPKYKKNMEKQKDLLDYRMGDLSKKDFVKKWGGKINGKEIEGYKNKKKYGDKEK